METGNCQSSSWERYDFIRRRIESVSKKRRDSLDLRHCSMNVEAARLVARCLQTDSKRFKQIDFSHNSLGEIGLRYLVDGLAASSNIECLRLSDVLASPRSLSFIGQLLDKLNCLVELSLGGNRLGNHGLKTILHHISPHKCLQRLDLSMNNISEVTGLASMLRCNCYLRKINLSRNQLVTVDCLSSAIQDNGCIENLDLSGNPIRNCDTLAFALKTNESLRNLSLKRTRITSISALMNVLTSENVTLDDLDLSENLYLRDECLQEIVCFLRLRRNKSGLRVLRLRSFSLSSTSYHRLIDGIAAGGRLRCVDLSNNQISEGYKLAYMIASNGFLEELNLDGNPLGSRGIQLIARALATNRNLSSLSVAQVGDGPGILNIESLVDVFRNRVQVDLSLDLRWNTLSGGDLDGLVEAAKENGNFINCQVTTERDCSRRLQFFTLLNKRRYHRLLSGRDELFPMIVKGLTDEVEFGLDMRLTLVKNKPTLFTR